MKIILDKAQGICIIQLSAKVAQEIREKVKGKEAGKTMKIFSDKAIKKLKIGKKKWIAEPELWQQVTDRKEYLSCPHCRAFLADVDPGTGNLNAKTAFKKELDSDRVHIPCYRCHKVLGKSWADPTFGDWWKALFFGRLSWAGVLIAAFVVSLLWVAGLMVIVNWNATSVWEVLANTKKGFVYLLFLGALPFPVTTVVLAALVSGNNDRWGVYPFWWIDE